MWRGLADLLYPQECAGCARLARGGLCRTCVGDLERIAPICSRCGAPDRTGACVCRRQLDALDRARQMVVYDRLARRLVHRMKYLGEHSLMATIGDLMAEWIAEQPAWLDREVAVTWVPVSADRALIRGFDQAEGLARHIAGGLGLAVTGLIARKGPSVPQVGLDPQHRRHNPEGAFVSRGPCPVRVILVDDVFTTGSTAASCAKALRTGGTRDVCSIAFARALPRGLSPDL